MRVPIHFRPVAMYGCAALLSCLGVPTASAVTIALDHAQDVAYAAETGGAWKGLNPTSGENPPGMDNGGAGFDTWNFAGGYNDPLFSPYGNLNHFIDGVDFAASSYNQLGSPAFGLTTGNRSYYPYTSRATRGFNSPLAVGDTLTIKFDNPLLFPQEFASAGFLFRLNTGKGPFIAGSTTSTVKNRLDLFTTTQRDLSGNLVGGNWTITDGIASTDTGLVPSATDSGTEFLFTLDSPESYSMQFIRLSDGAPLLSHSGSLENTGSGAIDSLEIAIFGNGSGNGMLGGAGRATGEREFFFNDLQVTAPLTGDYNHNGVVDAADYTVWRDTLGQSVPAGTGADGSGDGTVNIADYNLWNSNFGIGLAATSQLPNSVPEPGADELAVAAVGGLYYFAGSRRHGAVKSRCDTATC
jgi:hypothetical protein